MTTIRTTPSAPPAQLPTDQDTAGVAAQLWTSLATMLLLTLVCCGLYPLIVWGISQAVFPVQANGSLITKEGVPTTDDAQAVGSSLLSQNFAGAGYFHPRPSAAGNGYDAANSSGTNLGPISDKFLNGVHGSKKPDGTPDPASDFDGVKDLAIAYRAENGLAADALVPADAVTRSASGLDPHITPRNAALQKTRVAKSRKLSEDSVQRLIDQCTTEPSLGVLGERGVNVLLLNLALDRAAPTPTPPAVTPSAAAPDAIPAPPTTK